MGQTGRHIASFNGYAWQDTSFLVSKHPIAIQCARVNMLIVGITLCGKSSWQFPCVLYKFWRRPGWKWFTGKRGF